MWLGSIAILTLSPSHSSVSASFSPHPSSLLTVDVDAYLDLASRFFLSPDHANLPYVPFKVNLWAVARAGLDPSNGASSGVTGSSRSKQAPLGFEHALAVDLTALFGVRRGVGKDGGAKHIALLGNTLAVATDHAVFLLGLSFDVKGKSIFSRPLVKGYLLDTVPPIRSMLRYVNERTNP